MADFHVFTIFLGSKIRRSLGVDGCLVSYFP